MSIRRQNSFAKFNRNPACTIVQMFEMNQNKVNLENSEESTTDSDIFKPPKSCVTADRLNQIRKLVERAKEEKKTFTIRGGYGVIRNALLQRGWLEKIDNKLPLKTAGGSNVSSIDDVCYNLPSKTEWENPLAHAAKCEKMIVSRLLQPHDVDFYWSMRRDCGEWQERLNKNKTVNRFSRSVFTTKEGLCLLLQQMHWYSEPGVSEVRFPRCYTINFADQCAAFMEDFRITACISMLRWFTTTLTKEGPANMCSRMGKVPASTLHFAIARCNEFAAVKRHVDVDSEFSKIWEYEWDQFLTNFQLLVYKGEKFDHTLDLSEYADARAANIALKTVVNHWPQYDLDGVRNIWIMKPGNKCRGKDIQLIKDADDVIKVMNHKFKYVVQKYIERPLLIYNTKFDIRQWFLVTSACPLTIWMYRECYLRFSSKAFSLESFHESVHLTNHAIQYKYRTEKYNKALPDDKMWDSLTFKAYLRQIGEADQWYKVIYPGMRQCIVGAMLASQDSMDRRPNTFELFGADFMVTEDYTPWLIEINSCPAMGPTTKVTSKMCPQCYDDIIKVVIDKRANVNADTGLFDLIYKQIIPSTPPYLGMTLAVKGEKVCAKKKQVVKQKSDSRLKIRRPQNLLKTELDGGPHIQDLVGELQGRIVARKEQDENINKSVDDQKQDSSKRRKAPGVPDSALVTQKATASFLYKSKTNKAISVDRKPGKKSTSKKNSRSNDCTIGLKQREQVEVRGSRSSTKARKLESLYDNWRRGFQNKSTPTTNTKDTTWEQDTASILKCRSEFTINASKLSSNLVNPNYISSISNILPEIEMKTATTQKLCQNLFTVGLGYKNNYYKPIVQENIILPINTQQIIEACCLKS